MTKSQEYLLSFVKDVGGQINYDIYYKLFNGMTKAQYKEWVELFIRNGTIAIMTIPGKSDKSYTPKELINKLNKMGYNPEGKLNVKVGDLEYETNISYYVVDMNLRIPSQTVDKGLAVSNASAGVGALTGQQISASKMTLPETGILYGLGLDKVLSEILSPRGGDEGANKAMTQLLTKTGSFSLAEVSNYSTSGARSTKTMDAYFKGIHIKLLD